MDHDNHNLKGGKLLKDEINYMANLTKDGVMMK